MDSQIVPSSPISRAAQQVERDVARDIAWFTPPGEKHFDPVSVIAAFSTMLVTSFIAGFVEEAKKSSHDAGGSAFHRLAGMVEGLLGGKAAAPVVDDPAHLAAEAAATAHALPQEELRLTLTRTETGMRLYLEENMPEARAQALAAAIRQAATAQVLQAPA